ncbi:hypothetical protein SESBI_27794 [Sesbania bispinosa]|nr:hypothetical protein SESBI_27794 [Sesbania bispinosa]
MAENSLCARKMGLCHLGVVDPVGEKLLERWIFIKHQFGEGQISLFGHITKHQFGEGQISLFSHITHSLFIFMPLVGGKLK